MGFLAAHKKEGGGRGRSGKLGQSNRNGGRREGRAKKGARENTHRHEGKL